MQYWVVSDFNTAELLALSRIDVRRLHGELCRVGLGPRLWGAGIGQALTNTSLLFLKHQPRYLPAG
jgi:hypothetical protein